MKKTILFTAILGLAIAGCTNNQQTQTNQVDTTTTTESNATDSGSAATNEATVSINAGDDMKYDLSEIKVKEGQTVKLTLKHIGKMAKTVMGHNFVLLAQGTSLADFASKAIKAAGTDYIPTGSEKEIIAHTKLLSGGESDTIEFQAPAKGKYEFLCTFPGHWAIMKGTFIVE